MRTILYPTLQGEIMKKQLIVLAVLLTVAGLGTLASKILTKKANA